MTPSTPRVSVIIPNWNGLAWLPGCLQGLAAQTFRDFEIIVADNGSRDGSLAYLAQQHPSVRVLPLDGNRGFAAAVNAGIRASRSPYVALLNTDTRPRPDWLRSLVAALDRAGADMGSLASRMLSLNAPDTIDDAGDGLSWHGAATKRGHGQPAAAFADEADVFSACAGAALYRRSFLEELGGFDERFFAYLEDVDLGLRGQLRGYRCRYIPGAEVLHQGHGSALAHGRYVTLTARNRLLLFAKNIPLRLLVRHAGRLLYGQFYFCAVHRRPFHTLAGWLGFLALLPHALRSRRALRQTRRLSTADLDRLLTRTLGSPSLRELVRLRLRRPHA